ncbi:MAG: hypothetical protein ACM3JI_04590 [Anaerolineae bacterium]
MKIISGFILTITLLTIALIIVWIGLPQIISKRLSEKLKVEVSIGDFSLRPKEILIKNLKIANTPKAILPTAFSADLIRIESPLWHYLHSSIVIDEIVIDHVYLALEFHSYKMRHGNWTTLMRNLNTSPEKFKRSQKVLIKKLIITNLSVEVAYELEGKEVKKLPFIPTLEFDNITSEEGIPTDQIMKSVLGTTLKAIFEQHKLENMLETVLDPLKIF